MHLFMSWESMKLPIAYKILYAEVKKKDLCYTVSLYIIAQYFVHSITLVLLLFCIFFANTVFLKMNYIIIIGEEHNVT